jgi:dihydroflavonol-4-reductase
LAVESGKAVRELDYKLTDLDALLADTIVWMRTENMLS